MGICYCLLITVELTWAHIYIYYIYIYINWIAPNPDFLESIMLDDVTFC